MSQSCARLVDHQFAYPGLDDSQSFEVDLINCKDFSVQIVGESDDTDVLYYASNNGGKDYTLISTLEIGPTGGDGAVYWIEDIGHYTHIKFEFSPVNTDSDIYFNVLVLGAAE